MRFNSEIANIVSGLFSFILGIAFFIIYITVFSYPWREIILKKGVSQVFVKNKVKVNETFFDLYFKKQNLILRFFISFLIIFSVAFIVDIAFLTQIQWGYNGFYYRLISLMVPELGVLTAFVLLIIITMLTIKMLKIGKEIKEWRAKNQDNNFTLFENIITAPNNQIYNEFNDHEHLMFIITVAPKGKFKYQEASVVKFLYRNWKKKILKFNNQKLIDEFYYLLIFNYEEIPLNEAFYKLNDYAFIFQNKDSLLNEKN
ncbi:hypothetical protein KQ873_00745 [Mycoplasma zalophidermidis]|uniref:MAG0920 family protein n=1 Tax=Mycoplasma zalophidermidis TaxID=398174 RepID=UPI001C11530A|nr:hypothetical protein [Mycoplasma zalophidermidis]MBU4689569.1 hypothetical protein [Mycoplasma zalophidermidis]